MSFGFSAGDVVLFVRLAWKTVQNARKACGEHDELTREVSSLHVVIERLEKEASKPESPINRPNDKCKKELQDIVSGCEKVLKALNSVLEKYNALSKRERSAKRLWQRVRFSNGELADMRDLREKLTYYTSALSLFVNTISMGSIGRVEQQMETAGGDLMELRIAVNGITAHLLSTSSPEGSVLTTYADDDKAVWKEFRRELIEEGFSSSTLRKHKRLIKAYIKELGDRGLFDDKGPHDVEDLSKLAGPESDNHTTPLAEPQRLARDTSLDSSKTEPYIPAYNQLQDPENRLEPTPKDMSSTNSYSDAVRSANSQNATEIAVPDVFLHNPQFFSASFITIELPVYERPTLVPDMYDHLAVPSRDYLTGGITLPSVLFGRFQIRLQILLGCLPHLWIFRARDDMSEIDICVAKTTGIHADYEVVEDFARSAFRILVELIGSPVCAYADMWWEGFDAFMEHGSLLQKGFWTKLEVFISLLEWLFENLEVKDILAIGEWITSFDIELGAIAKRLTATWATAADLVMNSTYSEMRSLRLVLAEDRVRSESREEIENLTPKIPRSAASFFSSRVSRVSKHDGNPPRKIYGDSADGTTQGTADDLDGNACPPRNDKDGSCYSKDNTTGPSPSKAIHALPANDDVLQTIWEQNYISTVLPQCKNFILNPPSDTESRHFECNKLCKYIFNQIIVELDKVLDGSHNFIRHREKLVMQAQEMLFRLYQVRGSDCQRDETPQRRDDAVDSAGRQKDRPAVSKQKRAVSEQTNLIPLILSHCLGTQYRQRYSQSVRTEGQLMARELINPYALTIPRILESARPSSNLYDGFKHRICPIPIIPSNMLIGEVRRREFSS